MASVNSRVLQPSAPVVTNRPIGTPPMISAPQLATKVPLDWVSDDSLATLISDTAPVLPVTTETAAPCTYDGTATDVCEVDGTAHTALTAAETLSMPLPAPDVFGLPNLSGAEDSVPSLESPVTPPHGALHEPHAVVPNVCATAATAPILPQVMNLALKALVVSFAAPNVLADAHDKIAKVLTELEAPPPSASVIDAPSVIPQRKYTVSRKLKSTLTDTPKQLKKREQNRINQRRARKRKQLKLAELMDKVARLRHEMAQAEKDLPRLELLKSEIKMVRGKLESLVALLFSP